MAGPGKETVGSVTVKIYERSRLVNGRRYRAFEVADYSLGYRRLRSFSDGKKARAEAKRLATLLAAGQTTAASLRNSEAASFGRAMELIRETGVPLEIVAGHFAEAYKTLGADLVVEAAKDYAKRRSAERETRTVAETVADLLKVRAAGKASPRYLEDLRQRLGTFAEAFKVDVDSVTTSDVQHWLDAKKGSPRTRKNFRGALHTLFEFAAARNYIAQDDNPVDHTERISGRDNSAVEIFTPAEVARLLAAAPASFKPVIALGAFAGLRSAEVTRLDWADIDLAGGFIEVKAKKTKTRSRRLVPILPNLRDWLSDHTLKRGPVWPHSRPFFHEQQRDTAAATGKDGKAPVAWKANGLRHSFISYRLAEVLSAAQVALEAGNSPTVVFRDYREIVKPDAAKAYFSIGPDRPENVVAVNQAA
jgi:integrase